MSIVRWSPMKELENMRRDMERLFDEFVEPFPRRRQRWAWPKIAESGAIVPGIEMFDRKNEIVVRAELPGVDKKDIDLTITKDTLTLRGESRRPEEVKEEDFYLTEIVRGTFSRTIALPMEVENEKAKATFKDGILEIALPKKEESKPKEIKVEVA